MSELPKPGEVWGVPDKPETWRLVGNIDATEKTIDYETFSGSDTEWRFAEHWPTNYVRIFPANTNAE